MRYSRHEISCLQYNNQVFTVFVFKQWSRHLFKNERKRFAVVFGTKLQCRKHTIIIFTILCIFHKHATAYCHDVNKRLFYSNKKSSYSKFSYSKMCQVLCSLFWYNVAYLRNYAIATQPKIVIFFSFCGIKLEKQSGQVTFLHFQQINGFDHNGILLV